VSVLDPGSIFPELGASYADRHLRLAFHDAHDPAPGFMLPSPDHIASLLSFLDAWDGNELLLIHCRAGIGRSTATAFIAACHRNPHTPEIEIAQALRRSGPFARPNETWIAMADAALARDGRMTAAIVETGRDLDWLDIEEAEPFELPSRFSPG
jgi:predicted protein tyrosine phosphatase